MLKWSQFPSYDCFLTKRSGAAAQGEQHLIVRDRNPDEDVSGAIAAASFDVDIGSTRPTITATKL